MELLALLFLGSNGSKQESVKILRAQRVLLKGITQLESARFLFMKAENEGCNIWFIFTVNDYICILFCKSNLCLCAENRRRAGAVIRLPRKSRSQSYALALLGNVTTCDVTIRIQTTMIYKQVITDVMVNMSISLVVTGKNTENIIKCSPNSRWATIHPCFV